MSTASEPFGIRITVINQGGEAVSHNRVTPVHLDDLAAARYLAYRQIDEALRDIRNGDGGST